MMLFVAHDCNDKRKGYSDFAEATKGLDCLSVAIGKIPKNAAENVIHVGEVHDQSIIANYYSAADALVIPSFADNYPNTILESIACGTPVVGYVAGGIQSLMKTPHCIGVSVGNIDELRSGIRALISFDKVGNGASSELRDWAKCNWSPHTIALKYLALMNELVSG